MESRKLEIKDISDLYSIDLRYIEEHLDNDVKGYWARSFIKTSVSFFEAEIHLLKRELLDYSEEKHIIIPLDVRIFLEGKKYDLKPQGKIKERNLQVPLKYDIRFVFDQICIIKGFRLEKSYENSGWDNLIKTIDVRNRLTHPKDLSEQTITEIEKENCLLSLEWFFGNITGFLKQHTELQQNEIDKLKEKIIHTNSKESD